MIAKVDCGSDTIRRFADANARADNVESFYDVDEFLRFMACESFLYNEDGFLSDYHNFYFADDHGKLKLLPWDEDTVFSVFVDLDNYAINERRYTNLTFHKLMENESYYETYQQYIRKLNDEFLNPDIFLPWLKTYIELLAPYFQRDDTILMRSDDVLTELTTGNELYNDVTGNLLLTFKTYHEQANAVLSDESETFFIPQDMTLCPRDYSHFDHPLRFVARNALVPFRVCAGYWRLRRQAAASDATVWIGVLFFLVFVCVLRSVYPPACRNPKERKVRKAEKEQKG